MRLFYGYIKNFLQEDFNWKYYLTVSVFVALAIALNYHIDLEDGIIDRISGYPGRVLAFYSLFIGSYLAVVLINRSFNPDLIFLKNRLFWLRLFIGLLILSADVAIQSASWFVSVPSEIRYYLTKISSNLISLITILVPLLLFYKIIDHSRESFYGLTRKGFQVKPYFQLFAFILPLVIVASFFEGFQKQYPMYAGNLADEYWGVPAWTTMIFYELAYGWNFLSVELLFRGFLVIGMAKLMGRHAILPMAVVYSFIHFGKPAGECISSIFGGYLLGVIAYYSRSIWGGIIIHIGLAWLMESISALSKTYFQ